MAYGKDGRGRAGVYESYDNSTNISFEFFRVRCRGGVEPGRQDGILQMAYRIWQMGRWLRGVRGGPPEGGTPNRKLRKWTRSLPLARPSRAFTFGRMELPLLPSVSHD